MGSFSIKKGKKSLQGPRVTQGAFGSIKWEGKEWLTEGILIATELAGFAHPGGDVPPKDRLHRSTIPFPPLQTKCRDGTMLQEYQRSEHTMPGRYIVLPNQSRMLKDPVCPQELVITVSIVS